MTGLRSKLCVCVCVRVHVEVRDGPALPQICERLY